MLHGKRAKAKGYRLVNGCWNCQFVFRKEDYDEPYQYFCNKGCKTRPKCGSSCMDGEDYPFTISTKSKKYKQKMKMAKDWQDYSNEREVQPFGICKGYKWRTDEAPL